MLEEKEPHFAELGQVESHTTGNPGGQMLRDKARRRNQASGCVAILELHEFGRTRTARRNAVITACTAPTILFRQVAAW
jgi:hypothetical protein